MSTALWTAATPERGERGDRYRSLDAFAQALTLIESSYVDPRPERELIYDAIAGMAHNLDVHSTFLPPRRYQRLQEDTEGEFGDVGVTLIDSPVDAADPRRPPWPVVTWVSEGSPAEVAGIQVGDRLVAVNAVSTARPGSTLANADTWRSRLRGASGTRVRVTVSRVGWRTPREFAVIRAQLKVATVRQRALGEVGILTISQFSESTAADTRLALASLERASVRAVVLDLRANPGGLVDQAVAVADFFLDQGVIVTVRQRQGVERKTAHLGSFRGVLVALVDGGTASAAEIVASALMDNQRATVVGETTYGKGTVQSLYALAGGAGIKLTTGRYYTPAGNLLESNGIQPHVKVNRNIPDRNVRRTSSSQTPSAGVQNGATIALGFDDDPQLVAAVALARNFLRELSLVERRGLAKP
jgi:carboxyl-terminal processing protease